MKRDTKGLLFILAAAIVWSANSVLIKSLDLSGPLIAGMRAAFAGVFYAAFIRPKKLVWNWKLLLTLCVFTIQSACIVIAVKKTSAAIAIGMQFTAPIWIYAFSRVKGCPFYFRRALPLYILAAGVVVSMFSRAESVTLEGNLLALSTGFWFALLTLLNKDAGKENPIGLVSLENLFMAAVILPIFCWDSLADLAALDATSWIVLAALGIGQFGLGYVLYTVGLRHTTSAHASMISPLEMVLSPLWVALFIGERPDLAGLIGFGLIAAGIALEIVFTKKLMKAAKAAAPES